MSRTRFISILLIVSLSLVPIFATINDRTVAQTIEQLYQQANIAQAQGDYPEAERILRQITGKNSQVSTPYTALGIVLVAQGKNSEATLFFERASRFNRKDTLNYEMLGLLSLSVYDLVGAEMAYRHLVNLKPSDPEVYFKLGDVFGRQRKWKDSVLAYQAAIKLKPDWALAHATLGLALRQQGNYEAAIAAYRRAIELQSDFVGAYTGLGFTLERQGNLQAAETAYQQALKLAPYDASIKEELRRVELLLQRRRQ